MSRVSLFAILLATVVQLTACSPRATSYINTNVDLSYVQRVAIFPFSNMTQDIQAGPRVQSIFMSMLLEQGGLVLVDQGEVLNALQKVRISPEAALSSEQVVSLGKELNVQGIFFGSVQEYGQTRVSNTQVFHITASFSLLETETGSLVWNSQVSKNGTSLWRRLFGGGSASLYDVSRSAVRTAQRSLFR